MGRQSDKAKLRKSQKKEEKQKLTEYSGYVAAARKQSDPLGKFALFTKYSSKTGEFTLSCVRTEDVKEDVKEWAFDLTAKNMMDMYLNSHWGWDEKDKKDDLYHPDSWYLLATDSQDVQVGFVNFRFDMDYGEPVLYCYEIQLENKFRRHGIGRHLMKVLELIAFSNKMLKVVLTVFKHNQEASGFFQAMGYTRDSTSPEDFTPDFPDGCDYEILSKYNKHMLALEQKAKRAALEEGH